MSLKDPKSERDVRFGSLSVTP